MPEQTRHWARRVWKKCPVFPVPPCPSAPLCKSIYCKLAVITRSSFETIFDYKPQILGPKIEEFPFLVHELSEILTALQYKPQ
jgi:hypothetical protein